LAIGDCWVNFNLGCLHNAIQLSGLQKKFSRHTKESYHMSEQNAQNPTLTKSCSG
jgi:hypothetical protein